MEWARRVLRVLDTIAIGVAAILAVGAFFSHKRKTGEKPLAGAVKSSAISAFKITDAFDLLVAAAVGVFTWVFSEKKPDESPRERLARSIRTGVDFDPSFTAPEPEPCKRRQNRKPGELADSGF